jgi:regulation of enolase protein 1 (concanavalin A-like superfamily)
MRISTLFYTLVVGSFILLGRVIGDDSLGRWGQWVDPDKDCTSIVDGENLTIFVAGPNHDFCVDQNRLNAPRVTQKMDGDFIVDVLVNGEFQPLKPGVSDRTPYHGAGLFLASDDRNYIRMERAEFVRGDGKRFSYLNLEGWKKGQRFSLGITGMILLQEDEPTHLRIERHGKDFAFAFKHEKQPWTYVPTLNLDWADECIVGLIACNASNTSFEPRFSEYRLFIPKSQAK